MKIYTKKGILPAIPYPFRKPPFCKCECGRWFITKKGYEKHYVTKHIYEL